MRPGPVGGGMFPASARTRTSLMRRTPFISIFPLLALAATATGQSTLSARLTTLSPYGNFAQEGSAVDFQSIPATKEISAPGTTVAANLNNVSAATLISFFVRGDVVTLDVSEQGTGQGSATAPVVAGTTPSPSRASIAQGPHELLFEIRGRPGTRGLLELWATGLASVGTVVKLSVDIGNNQSIDFSSTPTAAGSFDRQEGGIMIPASGILSFRVVTSASLVQRQGYSVYKTGLSLRFTPGVACDVEAYGRSCGPRLVGTSTTTGTQRSLTLALQTAHRVTPGILLIGTTRLALAIPGTSCFLNSDAIATLGFVTDASGSALRRFDFPSATMFSLTLQDAVFPGLTSIETSNGVSVVCK